MEGETVPEGTHSFNIREVKIKENLTLPQACQRCHSDRDGEWVEDRIDELWRKGTDEASN